MPHKALHPCGHPGCPRLIEAGKKYCEEHRVEHRDEEIRPGRKHGNLYNTTRWQKLRRVVIAAHPVCQVCGKEVATVVDHIKPHRGDPELFFTPENLQALCKPCHDRKSFTEDGNPVYSF